MLVFVHARKEVITVSAVRIALNSMSSLDEPFKVAVGNNFTHEAAEFLATTGFRLASPAQIAKKVSCKEFPEPVHYSRTDSPGWMIKDWETANTLLRYLDPFVRPFVIFELPDGSYVQCLGSKRRLTVEVRECRAGGSFTHWVLGCGKPQRETVRIDTSTGTVTVDVSQVLTMRDARLIIRQFLETRTLPDRFHRQEITGRFTSSGNV